jgi:hypothetical protein
MYVLAYDKVCLMFYDGQELWMGDIPKMQGRTWLSHRPRPLDFGVPTLGLFPTLQCDTNRVILEGCLWCAVCIMGGHHLILHS